MQELSPRRRPRCSPLELRQKTNTEQRSIKRSSIHMDLRRGEDEEMGWEREVGAAAPWPPEIAEKKDEDEGGGGRREFSIYSKGEGCVWLSEIRGCSDDL